MTPYLQTNFYNPSATYVAAQKVRRDIDAARAKVAHHLGAKPSEIIFTAGGSEANNLAIHGVMQQFPKGNIVTSPIEHESVLAPAKRYNHKTVKVDPTGRVDLADLDKVIDDQTVLVSIMQANNEIGTIQPLPEISRLIAKKRQARLSQLPLLFHTDSCQAANYLDLHVARLGVDLMTINGGKIYGPKQSGSLYVKAGLSLTPLVDGGGQERGLRSGTENVAGLIGLSLALDIAQTSRHEEASRLADLQKHFIQEITKQLPNSQINGSLKHRLPNNIHLTLAGQDNETLILQLDKLGIQAAAGSACSASSLEASHVLKALGLSDQAARSSLRLSLGRQTTPANIAKLISVLTKLAG